MKIYLASSNFLGRDEQKKYLMLRRKGRVLFSFYFISQKAWQTKKIFAYMVTGKWG